jgi:uroporphyrin-III C-methyltransferase
MYSGAFTMHNRGKVYIIGAGPGDPELITVKGLRALKKADCLLYDFLSSPALLNDTKVLCEKICVGKADGLHLKEQDEINKLLYEKAGQHGIVVRLKGGDPFIFSRGYEEAAYLKKRGVEVEVVPGVTSALAGPESVGIPLTIKNKISSVGIVTGRKKDINASIDAPACDTLIYLMAVANITNVVKALRKGGWSKATPCAFIERATHADARIIRATVATIEKETRRAKIKPPAVLVVGEVVNYGATTEYPKETVSAIPAQSA